MYANSRLHCLFIFTLRPIAIYRSTGEYGCFEDPTIIERADGLQYGSQ